MPVKYEKWFAVCCLVCGMAAPALAQNHSELWGANGEKWSPQSRLPDFSFAGYHYGEDPIPDVKVVTDVTRHGAKGDGKTDCTQAFRDAIEQTDKGAIYIPPGRYVITGTIRINKSNIVLRGAGPEKTVLVIPKSLKEVQDDPKSEVDKRNFAFGGAYLEFSGEVENELLGNVKDAARRGDHMLTLDAKPDLKSGQLVQLLMEQSVSLGEYLHAGEKVGKETISSNWFPSFVNWVARVVAVEGNTVTLDRPLRVDVRLEWKPRLMLYQPSVSEVGVEDLTFEFPGNPKKKHLQEEGFNAIHAVGPVHSWIRNVHIVDADLGILLARSRFWLIDKVVLRERKRKGQTGHHGLWVKTHTQGCVFTDFRVDTTFVHDLTVEGFAHGNVFRNGSGRMINLDHHRNAPYENLFSNINLGNAKRIWASSGKGSRGPHAAARETFWNLSWDSGNPPGVPNWAQINYIGRTSAETDKTQDGPWIEAFEGPVAPDDLYEAQLRKRGG